jgi:hypothetical protein
MHQCTRFADHSVGFGKGPNLYSERCVEWTQLKNAQCTINSGGPMASGACVASAQKPSESRRRLTTKSWGAATEAAGATSCTASRVPSDALRPDDETRWQQSAGWSSRAGLPAFDAASLSQAEEATMRPIIRQ